MTGSDVNTQDTRPTVTTRVRQQAYTLEISDSFLLLPTCCVACLVVVSFISKVPTQYGQITAASVETR
jgi:DHA2 family multidrug resistance protein